MELPDFNGLGERRSFLPGFGAHGIDIWLYQYCRALAKFQSSAKLCFVLDLAMATCVDAPNKLPLG
jgi:hypothetical protein